MTLEHLPTLIVFLEKLKTFSKNNNVTFEIETFDTFLILKFKEKNIELMKMIENTEHFSHCDFNYNTLRMKIELFS